MSFTKLWVGKYNHERIGPIGLSLLIAILFLVFLLLLLQKKMIPQTSIAILVRNNQ